MIFMVNLSIYMCFSDKVNVLFPDPLSSFLSYSLVYPVSSGQQLASHQRTSHGSVFFHDLPSSEIVFSLKSHPCTTNYLRTRGFSKCLCFYLQLFTFTCLMRRNKTVTKCTLSVNPTCYLSLCLSHGQIFLSAWQEMYSNILKNISVISHKIYFSIKLKLISCWFWQINTSDNLHHLSVEKGSITM